MLRLNTLGGLWIESSGAHPAPAPKPRRLALLALLAAAGEAGTSRDRLLGVLWPDRDESRARHALSQTLYSLRRDLGIDAVVAEATLRLDFARIGSDLEEFRAAVARSDWHAASSLYRGPFLDGFYLQDAPAFELWVDGERQRVRAEASRALEAARDAAIAAGDRRAEAEFARRLVDLDPLSSRFALGYMRALVALGDRAGALAHERSHAAAVREGLDADPDPAVASFAADLRSGAARAPRPAEAAVSRPPSRDAPLPSRDAAGLRPRAAGLRWWHAGVVAAVVVGLALWLRNRPAESPQPVAVGPTLAVGRIRDVASPDSAEVSQILADMLTTSLGRLTSLDVIATSRLLELLPSGETDGPDSRAVAARHAGATEIIEGEVVRLGDGRLQFDVRRVDLAGGMVRRGYRVSGTNRFDLIDSATAVIAADLRAPAPAVSIAEVTTRSPIAFRFYEDGLRAFYQFDRSAAGRLFRSALREDSTFAMAAYYAWRSGIDVGAPDAPALAALATRLSTRATRRDRLIIRAHVAAVHDDPSGFAAAESLVVSHPNDPEALARAADVFRRANEPLERVTRLLQRAASLDSAASASTDTCRSCAHLAVLAAVYREADSGRAAEDALRRWIGYRPDDPAPWLQLARMLEETSQFTRADTAYAAVRAVSGGANAPAGDAVWRAASRADAAAVGAACRAAEAPADRRACQRAHRLLGRLREALLLRPPPDPVRRYDAETMLGDTVTTVMLDFEAGRFRLAAESFRRLADFAAEGTDGRAAAQAVRYLALAASAHHVTTDSLQLKPLADRISELERRALSGRRSPFGAFVRGLLLAEAGRHDEAAVAFMDARGWAVAAFPRIDRELGRSAVAGGRPASALEPLRAAMRARPDGWGAGVNRGELHALLGDAFAALGQTDSARVHYEWVTRAWAGADPPLDTLRQRVRSWLDAERQSPRSRTTGGGR